MSPHALFLPVAVLALWTMTVLLLVPLARFRAASAGTVTVDDFRHGESARVPPHVSLPNRVFMNLLEVPVLFYVAAGVIHLLGINDGLMVGLAWAFVALRLAHSLIYLTYNRVLHRLAAFALGNVVVVVIWARVLLHLW